ncbi:MAG TPA: hypothetical protein VH933_03255 [Aestuariivirgaceae bacterium]|jgi:hypothetical protein
MKLATFNLTQPANVHWRNPSQHNPALGDRQRHFASVNSAIRFVMEDLRDFPQTTAWIATGAGNLSFDEIKALFFRRETGINLLD